MAVSSRLDGKKSAMPPDWSPPAPGPTFCGVRVVPNTACHSWLNSSSPCADGAFSISLSRVRSSISVSSGSNSLDNKSPVPGETKSGNLTRLPSKEHLRWQQTRKLFAYRDSTHTILSVTCPWFGWLCSWNTDCSNGQSGVSVRMENHGGKW